MDLRSWCTEHVCCCWPSLLCQGVQLGLSLDLDIRKSGVTHLCHCRIVFHNRLRPHWLIIIIKMPNSSTWHVLLGANANGNLKISFMPHACGLVSEKTGFGIFRAALTRCLWVYDGKGAMDYWEIPSLQSAVPYFECFTWIRFWILQIKIECKICQGCKKVSKIEISENKAMFTRSSCSVINHQAETDSIYVSEYFALFPLS